MSDTTLNTSETFAPIAKPASRTDDSRWTAGRAFRFVVFSSAALWTLIVAGIAALI